MLRLMRCQKKKQQNPGAVLFRYNVALRDRGRPLDFKRLKSKFESGKFELEREKRGRLSTL